MKKIIAALGVWGGVLSPSLGAMENFDVGNGLSGMKRDTVLRICDVIGGYYESVGSVNIRNMIGMCVEHFLWKQHSYFVEGRKRKLAACILKLGQDFYENVQGTADLELRIEKIDDVIQMLHKAGLPFNFNIRACYPKIKIYSARLSHIIVPLIKTMFVFNKLSEPEHFLEDAVRVGMSRIEHTSHEVGTALELMNFFLKKKVISNYALFILWTFGVPSIIPCKKEITFTMIGLGANINDYKCCDQYSGCGYTRTVLDKICGWKKDFEDAREDLVRKESIESINKNISFLKEECGAKKFEELLPEVRKRAQMEYEEKRKSEKAKQGIVAVI